MANSLVTGATYRVVFRWRSIGIWFGLVIALLQLVNALRTAIDPSGFASYLGLPLGNPADALWVQVYGLRAALLGALAAYLILRNEINTLKWLALFAAPVAIGDAMLVLQSGGSIFHIARHLGISAFLMVTAFLLHREIRSTR